MEVIHSYPLPFAAEWLASGADDDDDDDDDEQKLCRI